MKDLIPLTELPAADVIPKRPTLIIGEELVLTCTVNKATLEIKWKKDGASEIPRAKVDEREGISVLSIPKVVKGDSGEYSCEAHNQAGQRSFTAEVKVESKDTLKFLVSLKNFFVCHRASNFLRKWSGFALICSLRLKKKKNEPRTQYTCSCKYLTAVTVHQ